jgi:predicted nucleotidyltransferase
LAALKLRDRDTIVTKEGLIFRVFGYDHPPDAYICDLEYAPKSIFNSSNPKAPRGHSQMSHYKLYEDESWTYLAKHYPQYLIPHAMLQRNVIGVKHCDIVEVRRPDEKLRELLARPEKDRLITATQDVLDLVTKCSGLRLEDFGVFGSMLHGFHHPKLSDIDLVIYGREKVTRLRQALGELYNDGFSPLRNEFETDQAIRGKRWRFHNFSPEEHVWHQRRKMVYALFTDERSGRIAKTEFEPVKDWKEISNGYNSRVRVLPKGWVKMTARITEDCSAPFIPSVYGVQPLEVMNGPEKAVEVRRVVSYVEEFRMQSRRDEAVYAEGNLEEVVGSEKNLFQVALTYCPRYYEQVLRVASRIWDV